MTNGKGDAPRLVDRERYGTNFNEIQWNDGSSVDCESCEIGCGYFRKTGVVCFPLSEQQKPKQVCLRNKGKKKAED